MSQPRGYPANFPRQLQWVAKLYQARYLDDDSSVWINTNAVSPVFWTFNGIAAAIYWFAAPTAGSVRLTEDRIRWAPSYKGAKEAPSLDLSLSNLSVVDRGTRLTFVVDNSFLRPGATVGVAEGRNSYEMLGGYYEGSGVSVVDLPRFDPDQLPDLTPSRRDYEQGLARYQGLQLLQAGMQADARADVVDNTDNYRVDLGPDTLAALVGSITAFTDAATLISGELFADRHIDTGHDD